MNEGIRFVDSVNMPWPLGGAQLLLGAFNAQYAHAQRLGETVLGIELGASGVTLSSGERLEFKLVGAPNDLLLRIADDAPVVRVANHDNAARVHDVTAAADLYADLLAAALRADRLDLGQLGLDGQLGLAGPLNLAVPGWWSSAARARLASALSARGLRATLVNGAEAAVHGYLLSGGKLPDTVAVVSAKHDSVSMVLVQHCNATPQALLSPVVVIREGGDALDAAVLRHLLRGLEGMGDSINREAPETIDAARAALSACQALRESLSVQATVAFDPPVPGASHRVLLARSELDEVATPWIERVTSQISAAFDRSSHSAEAVLLSGGLSAMPLLAHRLSAALGVEIQVTADPSVVVAKGAETLAAAPAAAKRGFRSLWPFKGQPRTRELVLR